MSTAHPFPENILLVVEVAKSSLQYDRTVKQEFYATANIPEYWLVDLQDRRVVVWRSPIFGSLSNFLKNLARHIQIILLSLLLFRFHIIIKRFRF
jgi:Uma2 family endonuclease